MKKKEDGKKTEQLHLALSRAEKEMFFRMAKEETEKTGQRITVTRLIKERVLEPVKGQETLQKLKRTLWNLRRLETDLLQAKEQAEQPGLEEDDLYSLQREIRDQLSEIQAWMRRGERADGSYDP